MRITRGVAFGVAAVGGVAVVLGLLVFRQWPSPPTVSRGQPGSGTGHGGNLPEQSGTFSFNEQGRRFREYGNQYDRAGSADGTWAGYGEINGQLAYVASTDGSEVVVYRGREYGRELGDHGGITDIADVGGQPGLIAIMPSRPSAVGVGAAMAIGGHVVETAYDYLRELAVVAGKAAYVGVTFDGDSERSRVVYDGKEYGQNFFRVAAPFAYESAVAFFGYRDAADSRGAAVVVDRGREELLDDTQYDGLSVRDRSGHVVAVAQRDGFRDTAIVAGKLVSVPDPPPGERAYATIDSERLGAEYQDVFEVAAVNGKLALLVSLEGRGVVVYDGRIFGRRFDTVYAAPVKNDPYGWRLPAGTFTAIKHVGDVGGKLTYVATVGFTEDGEPKNIIVVEE